MTTTTILPSSSSRASRHPVCHIILLARYVVRGSGAVGVAAVVVRGRCSSFHGRWGRFGVFVVVGRSQSFVGWPSFAGRCPLLGAGIDVLGSCCRVGQPEWFVVVWVARRGMQATWRAHALLLTLVTWPCGHRVCVVVFFCRRLSWFIGGWGCDWWWGLLVGDVVVRRSRRG